MLFLRMVYMFLCGGFTPDVEQFLDIDIDGFAFVSSGLHVRCDG